MKELPIEWQFPEGLITRYANQMFLMTAESEYILCFFEVKPPILTGKTEAEMEARAQQIKSIPAECVARIVIAKERLPAFLRAMNVHAEQMMETENANVEGHKGGKS